MTTPQHFRDADGNYRALLLSHKAGATASTAFVIPDDFLKNPNDQSVRNRVLNGLTQDVFRAWMEQAILLEADRFNKQGTEVVNEMFSQLEAAVKAIKAQQ